MQKINVKWSGMIEQLRNLFKALSITFLFCIFSVACSSQQPSNENEANLNAPQTENLQELAVDEPNGQLLIWASEADKNVWENTVLSDFQEKYPFVDIKIENYPAENVASKVGVARLAGQTIPDLAVGRMRDIQSLIARDDLMDITPLLESHSDKFNPEILAYCKEGDVFYCVPWYVGPTVLFYRRDVFEAANLPSDPETVSEIVATWDDFLTVCVEIRRRVGLMCLPYIYQSLLIDMMWQQGIHLVDQDGQVNLDDPAIVLILEKIKEFRDKRVIHRNVPEADGWENDLSADVNDADTPPVAAIIYPSTFGHTLKNQFETSQEGNWGVVPMPAWEEGGARASIGSGSSFIIPTESSNPDAAWAFVEFMALNEENQLAQFAYSDYFPTLNITYEDPIFSEEDPFYGNQNSRLLFREVVNNVPDAAIFGINNYSVIISEMDAAVNNLFARRMDAQEALQEAAQAVRLKLGT